MALEPSVVKDFPPIIFPWEAIREGGTFCPKEEFPHVSKYNEYELFQCIWDRAEKEVAAAATVSFVGISMHPFMQFAFNFLFRNKEGPFNVLSVNPSNRAAKNQPLIADPLCPAGKLNAFFEQRKAKNKYFNYKLRWMESFQTFIAEEMG